MHADGIHECEKMQAVEELGAALDGAWPPLPRTACLTRAMRASELAELDPEDHAMLLRPDVWLLQLCTGRATVIVVVQHCPFCGLKL